MVTAMKTGLEAAAKTATGSSSGNPLMGAAARRPWRPGRPRILGGERAKRMGGILSSPIHRSGIAVGARSVIPFRLLLMPKALVGLDPVGQHVGDGVLRAELVGELLQRLSETRPCSAPRCGARPIASAVAEHLFRPLLSVSDPTGPPSLPHASVAEYMMAPLCRSLSSTVRGSTPACPPRSPGRRAPAARPSPRR